MDQKLLGTHSSLGVCCSAWITMAILCSWGGNGWECLRAKKWCGVLRMEFTTWKFCVSVWRNENMANLPQTVVQNSHKRNFQNTYRKPGFDLIFCVMMIQLFILLTAAYAPQASCQSITGPIGPACACFGTIQVTKTPGKVPTQALGEKSKSTKAWAGIERCAANYCVRAVLQSVCFQCVDIADIKYSPGTQRVAYSEALGTLTLSEVNPLKKRGPQWRLRWNAETGKDAFLKSIHKNDVPSHWNVKGRGKLHCTKKAMAQISLPKAPTVCWGCSISLLSLQLHVQNGVMSEKWCHRSIVWAQTWARLSNGASIVLMSRLIEAGFIFTQLVHIRPLSVVYPGCVLYWL